MKSLYDIVIAGSSFAANAAPANGFIDPKSIYQYMSEEEDFPASLSVAEAKMRASRRFVNIVAMLNSMGNAYVRDVTCNGSLAAAPTTITLRVEFEHGDGCLVTDDESNAGARIVGAAAIRRCVARGMQITESRHMETFDPTDMTIVSNGANKTIPRGIVSNIAQVGAVANNLSTAEAAITVTKITS